ncbi:hypothetical protein L6452_03687 [Arctium lappa]|uniref:Uncharacterized protein n=1 Tax=Arctium lappa TaxID=4217 RepID=A0ACB9FNV5_ARCLA|nr:hypothetical protein L6452_03687 [Arctium lappa]
MNKLRGDYVDQYTHLRDYICEVQRTNPDTTMKLEVESASGPASDTRRFKRIYFCLGALKKGFKDGMREFHGLDGAFMKGPYPGQILSAVGIDSNTGIYPVAYAIVEAKTTSSWSWFLDCLGDDLDLDARSNFTFITERQKGVIPAISKVFPCAEHRLCFRHVHENMKLQWRGKQYKDLLWKCAATTTPQHFKRAMDQVKGVSVEAFTWLNQITPKHWTRAYFTGRDKPIVTALEYIRQYLMKRIVTVQKVIAEVDRPLTPTATKMLEAIKKEALHYNALWMERTNIRLVAHRIELLIYPPKSGVQVRETEKTEASAKTPTVEASNTEGVVDPEIPEPTRREGSIVTWCILIDPPPIPQPIKFVREPTIETVNEDNGSPLSSSNAHVDNFEVRDNSNQGGTINQEVRGYENVRRRQLTRHAPTKYGD